jgi:excisionase family DNA binding protein
MENKIDDDLITVDEMCDMLMIGKGSAYKLLKSGKIKCFQLCRSWKIPRQSVYDFINKESSTAK